MKTRELEKYYLCLLYGKPKRDSDTLHGYMTKNESKNKVTVFKMKLRVQKKSRQNMKFLTSTANSALPRLNC